ncbi:MAG: VOC family protein [Blastocatellia bacterium]
MPRILVLFALLSLCAFGLFAQSDKPAAPQTPPSPQAAQPAAPPAAHFHHMHLNVTDPAAAIEFYASRFAGEKARFAGRLDALWTQKSWILFSKVAQAPPLQMTSAIWHMGWGAENMKAEYDRQLKLNTKFFEPLNDISDIGGNTGAKDLFYYAYVQSPDNALIELNTANHHNFGHLHLFSKDPVGAGEWYAKYFGAVRRGRGTPSREPRLYRGHQIGPSMSLMMDNVNIIIFPVEYSHKAYADQWKGKTEIESTRGKSIDHIGFSVDNLSETIEMLRKDGVKITLEPRTLGTLKIAFIEGPDKISIELVEGHAKKE